MGKTPPAILYNLRGKSGPKIKYEQSYSYFTTQITLTGSPPLYLGPMYKVNL
jgi:hypothetical protein